MGNLLGAPVTEKETHTGTTKDEGLKFGLSSMQGWRVHMEDAHIAEGDLYALKTKTVGNPNDNTDNTDTNNTHTTITRIHLPGHALFAVFDGHGGTFAAQYSGRNFLRVLARQEAFVKYAELIVNDTATTTGSHTNSNSNNNSNSSNSTRAERMGLLETALKQAFVETDYEIALAIRGHPHPHANLPYHNNIETEVVSAGDGAGTTTTTMATSHPDASVVPMPDDESSASASSAAEAAASKAAADHVMALDDDGDSGTTACMVLITPHDLVCANAGDSRAVFCRKTINSGNNDDGSDDGSESGGGGPSATTTTTTTTILHQAVPLSYDHKPDDEGEERRIRWAGGYVAGGRVEGDLAVSRGLGDFRFKHMPTVLNNTQLHLPTVPAPAASTTTATTTTMPPGDQKVSPVPDVIVHGRDDTRDEFVLVACDGIWDVRSNQECVTAVVHLFEEGEQNLGLISEEVIDECLRLGSKDNMTVIVIQLPGQQQQQVGGGTSAGAGAGSSGGVMGRRQRRNSSNSGGDNDVHQQQQQQEQQYSYTGRDVPWNF